MNNIKIRIIALGNVVLTLTVDFAKKFPVIGFDINSLHVSELSASIDKFCDAVVLNFAHDQFKNFSCKNYVKGSHIIFKQFDNGEATNQIYNFFYSDQTTLKDLTEQLKELLGDFDNEIRGIDLIHGFERCGDVSHILASIEKAKRLLFYKLLYSLKEGLKMSVQWNWRNMN